MLERGQRFPLVSLQVQLPDLVSMASISESSADDDGVVEDGAGMITYSLRIEIIIKIE